MRFILASIDHARRGAKVLRDSLHDTTGKTASLGECQAAVAEALGYSSWAELKVESGRPGRRPSAFDQFVDIEETRRRGNTVMQVYRRRFGLSAEQAAFLEMVAPLTRGADPSGPPPVQLRYRRGVQLDGQKAAIDFELELAVPEMHGAFEQVGTFSGQTKESSISIPILRRDGRLFAPFHQERKRNRIQDVGQVISMDGDDMLLDEESAPRRGLPWGLRTSSEIATHWGRRMRRTLLDRHSGLVWSSVSGLMHECRPHWSVDPSTNFAVTGLFVPTSFEIPLCFGSEREARAFMAYCDRHRSPGVAIGPQRVTGGGIDLREAPVPFDFAATACRAIRQLIMQEAMALPEDSRRPFVLAAADTKTLRDPSGRSLLPSARSEWTWNSGIPSCAWTTTTG